MIEGAIFVFGSNLAGRHGKGAALEAKQKYGAIQGQGVGRQGQAYAIPTRYVRLGNIFSLPIDTIKYHVDVFLKYAAEHAHETFFVTALGTGLAGYKNEEIAPMFANSPQNCVLPEAWKQFNDRQS